MSREPFHRLAVSGILHTPLLLVARRNSMFFLWFEPFLVQNHGNLGKTAQRQVPQPQVIATIRKT
jgi:hypothetical protein